MVVLRNSSRIILTAGSVLLAFGGFGALAALRNGGLGLFGESSGTGPELFIEVAFCALFAAGGAALLAWALVSRIELDLSCIRKINLFGRTSQSLEWTQITEARPVVGGRGGVIQLRSASSVMEVSLSYRNIYELAATLRDRLSADALKPMLVQERSDFGSCGHSGVLEFRVGVSALEKTWLFIGFAAMVIVVGGIAAYGWITGLLLALAVFFAMAASAAWRVSCKNETRVVVSETEVRLLRGKRCESITLSSIIAFFHTSTVDDESGPLVHRFLLYTSDRSFAFSSEVREWKMCLAAIRDRISPGALVVLPWISAESLKKAGEAD